MFVSFFPRPRLFFSSAILWSLFAILVWNEFGKELGQLVGFHQIDLVAPPIVDVSLYWSQPFIWFYVYSITSLFIFYMMWAIFSPHKWQVWSILGTACIIFTVYISVQILSTVVGWSGPYFDLFQKAISTHGEVQVSEFYMRLIDFLGLAFLNVAVEVGSLFFVSHYIFRWRTAMNDYYMDYWQTLRVVEGASQRVQEDTMRFASTLEQLGVGLIKALMSLAVFLPLLLTLTEKLTELPLIGKIPHGIVIAVLVWSLFGTGLLAVVGIKLPGLEFNNQRVEAAYRKELVLGEDSSDRAAPAKVRDLFSNVRKNYFKLYFHYAYFNVARSFYGQADSLLSMVLLVPSMVAGLLTMGLYGQISSSMSSVSSAFQYLVNSWTTIVELMSIHKRLRGFESMIDNDPLFALEHGNLGLIQ